MNEQEARLALMSPAQRTKHLDLADRNSATNTKEAEKQLEKIRQEEVKGKITVYENNDNVMTVCRPTT